MHAWWFALLSLESKECPRLWKFHNCSVDNSMLTKQRMESTNRSLSYQQFFEVKNFQYGSPSWPWSPKLPTRWKFHHCSVDNSMLTKQRMERNSSLSYQLCCEVKISDHHVMAVTVKFSMWLWSCLVMLGLFCADTVSSLFCLFICSLAIWIQVLLHPSLILSLLILLLLEIVSCHPC